MKTVLLNNQEIKVDIKKKRNKNTYFYFKKEGYIEVRLSLHHTEKYVLNHIKKNCKTFLQKLEKAKSKPIDNLVYYLFGNKLQKEISDQYKEVTFSDDTIKLPVNYTDQLKIIEKKLVLQELHNLHLKYINNPFVDIRNITLKTRYTTTRFGSCNAVKRNINISTHLVHYDKVYMEYVFLHEIAHLTHQNHGPLFYQLLDKLCPNHRTLKQELKNQFR